MAGSFGLGVSAPYISDIGGFSGNPVDDVFHTEGPELYLRWLQWGAYSPILRTHCRYCEQRVWTWGDNCTATSAKNHILNHFSRISQLNTAAPDSRRVLYSTWCPCVWMLLDAAIRWYAQFTSLGFELMRRPLVLRSNIVPYTYTHAAIRSYGAGEALLTPTYWDPAAATEVRWRMRLTRIGDD